MNIKLLPCPFCGGEARLMNIDDYGHEVCINYEDELDVDCSFVHCYNCDMDFMPHTETAREVLEAWNTRKPMERILKQLETSAINARNYAIEFSFSGNHRIVHEQEFGVHLGFMKAIEIVKGGVDNAE